ncbi:epoxide hydrolase 4-like [Lycorma delicatula]|uniref:epoxide hydrolase 4-like n=1 Tax=Lycorma delicatula TaxID=130591 RepID=UPI003F510652
MGQLNSRCTIILIRIIAPDLRGYGDSEKPAGRKYYQIKYLVEDVKNLINALGREKATIVAHDWGGIIAWFFVMIYSQMVDSYVIMNAPHPIIFRKFISTSFTQLRMSWYFFFFQIPYLPELFIQLRDLRFLNVIFYTKKKASPYNEEDKEAYRFTFAKPGALTPPINYYRANLMLNLMPDKNFLKSIPKDDKNLPPGLLLFGEKDIAIHVDSIIGTDRIIPNLSIEIIKDATHFVQQDDPDAVNQLMQDFFVKLPKLKKEIEARE